MMTRYLVIGGAGFIGSNIVRVLSDKGKQVSILNNFQTGKRENIRGLNRAIEVMEGDFTNYETIKKAVKDVDIIIHQGAIPSVPKSIQDPIQTDRKSVV